MIQQLPLLQPKSDWVPPDDFPDLSWATTIGLDLETRDPKLKTHGPGTIRKDGYVVGVALAATDEKRFWSGYYPIRHEGGGNLDRGSVFRWAGDQLGGPQPKVGANLLYDLEWLRCEAGIAVQGPLWDVQVAEPLLDEESSAGFALDVLAKKYLGQGKDESLLREAARAWGLQDVKGGLWALPPRFVGPYAESDALAPLRIITHQRLLMEQQGLMPIFNLESELIPLLLEMRLKGVRVDLEKAAKLSKLWKTQQDEHKRTLDKLAGCEIDPWSGPALARACDGKGIPYLRTDAGNPSFTTPWLKTQGHEPFLQALHGWRAVSRLREVYVDGLAGYAVGGRIHCQFHALRKDEEGTRGGRFSSTNPNLQQVPSRDEELAPLIRGLFIPDEGGLWGKLDYSQQEPRVLVHFACLRGLEGADEIRDAWRAEPHMDFYTRMKEFAKITRFDAKTVSLAMFYGMGIDLLAEKLNRSVDEARVIYDKYNEIAPFFKQLSKECALVANKRGYIKTVLGRHRHFNLWEWNDYSDRTKPAPLPLALAQKAWPNKALRRAYTHKALNALIQGSSADMTKAAMLQMWKEKKNVPQLTVHDEIDNTIYSPEEGQYMKDTMENIVQLCVPIVAELTTGPSWGEQK